MEGITKIVLNTSSSIFFTKIGLIPKLLKKIELITTEEILEEIKEGEEIGFKDARIIMQYINDNNIKIIKTKKTKVISKEFKIKETDASVISLAQELNCPLATEDRQIEKICLVNQTKILNTALLVYYLWKIKQIKDEQTFLLLEILIKNGYNKEICSKIKQKIWSEKNV